ncbi:hypothetical protein TEA_027953 [Camellia sinensis var. sinensis]|uniref:Uncharacterized protein n=1 Tax=Camellia sinensis var. sinensis TaxID=542762 RepID=A0A4S4DL64_CAMSN|nr:hypothetical protein TEA_027953 [Camellia sinensis var. sinensis]
MSFYKRCHPPRLLSGWLLLERLELDSIGRRVRIKEWLERPFLDEIVIAFRSLERDEEGPVGWYDEGILSILECGSRSMVVLLWEMVKGSFILIWCVAGRPFEIRLAEAQQQKTVEQDMKPEQLEKMAKLEGWRKELKLLEDTKAELS